MSGNAWLKCEAEWRDFVYLDSSMHLRFPNSNNEIDGFSLYRYGQLLAVWGIVQTKDKNILVMVTKPKMRRFPRVMIEQGWKFLEGRSDLYTYAQADIDRSDAYIKHFGFKPTGENVSGMKEYYYG